MNELKFWPLFYKPAAENRAKSTLNIQQKKKTQPDNHTPR